MKSIEVEINGKMTPVCFAEDVDKVISEIRERHEAEIKELRSRHTNELTTIEEVWKGHLKQREKEIAEEVRKQQQEEQERKARERMPPPPRTFFEDTCQILRTCEREGNPAPAYDFLRGLSAGWWLCNEINLPPEETVEDSMRKWVNRPKEK